MMTTQTEPDILYHYTSQKGLLGILKDDTLKMTNILYLNDSNEFFHPISLFQEEWKNRVNETLDNLYSKKILNMTKEMISTKKSR